VGILIEEHEAKFPLWLAPVQAVILNITDKQAEFAKKVQKNLASQGFKVELDLRNEKVGYKIREHILQRVPYMLVIGDRELETNTVAVRTRSGEDLGTMSIDEIAKRFSSEIACRGHAVLEE
jgi:threonyl-tRNA synthetase